ncbi:MAG: hypothetical protein KME05_01740 [Gloeocapsa sp. UFS-A4-WI-NPMV-4B04]|nr:hypothetical protein [Gloeocapsa sp. UFS-A4-WI-NPMV-4B04]
MATLVGYEYSANVNQHSASTNNTRRPIAVACASCTATVDLPSACKNELITKELIGVSEPRKPMFVESGMPPKTENSFYFEGC